MQNRVDSAIFGLPTPPDSASGSSNGTITCWLLDTRSLWPGDNILAADGAAKAMALISMAEQNVITSKMWVADARMSLGSALLKRLFITKTLGIPWKEVKLGRKGDPKHGKPCAVDDEGKQIEGLDFNISHQGGLVSLVGWNGRRARTYQPNGMVSGLVTPGLMQDVTVGTDIVYVNERNDYRTIDAEGFDGWVDLYDSIFSEAERWSMIHDVDYVTLLDGTIVEAHDIGRHDRCIARNKMINHTAPCGRKINFSSEQLIEAKLRRFYTFFCYKEAYIKLSGEALLAPWIKDVEFFNVRSPRPGTQPRCSKHGVWGEEIDHVEVHLHGQEVTDVKMTCQAFEENIMLANAIQGDIEGLKVPEFTSLHLETDILAATGDFDVETDTDSD